MASAVAPSAASVPWLGAEHADETGDQHRPELAGHERGQHRQRRQDARQRGVVQRSRRRRRQPPFHEIQGGLGGSDVRRHPAANDQVRPERSAATRRGGPPSAARSAQLAELPVGHREHARRLFAQRGGVRGRAGRDALEPVDALLVEHHAPSFLGRAHRDRLFQPGGDDAARRAYGLDAVGEARMRGAALELRVPPAGEPGQRVQLDQRPHQRLRVAGQGHRAAVALRLVGAVVGAVEREREHHHDAPTPSRGARPPRPARRARAGWRAWPPRWRPRPRRAPARRRRRSWCSRWASSCANTAEVSSGVNCSSSVSVKTTVDPSERGQRKRVRPAAAGRADAPQARGRPARASGDLRQRARQLGTLERRRARQGRGMPPA